MKEFGERLTTALANTGRQLKEISKELDISKASLINYKNGKTPHIDAAIKLAGFCNVSLDWLLTGKEYELNDNERDIITRYRTLNESQKKSIHEIINSIKPNKE